MPLLSRPRLLALVPSTLAVLAGVSACTGNATLPGLDTARDHGRSPEEAGIEAQPICVGSTTRSAGQLGKAIFYQRVKLPDGRLAVGYYVFFSTERPWGNNWLTWSVLPALAVDLVYTRGLLVAPGIQAAAYGKGDVEGFRVFYVPGPDGRLRIDHAVADDGGHTEQLLERGDLFAVDPERLTVYTTTWSHQLGGKGAGPGDLVYERCYEAGAIRPLTPAIASEFHLERRASPADVLRLTRATPAASEVAPQAALGPRRAGDAGVVASAEPGAVGRALLP